MAGKGVFLLLPGDVDPARGGTLDELAARTARVLELALVEARDQRRPTVIVEGMLRAIGLTAGLLLVFGLTRSLRRRLEALAIETAKPRSAAFQFRGFHFLEGDAVYVATRRVIRLVTWGVYVFASYFWLSFVLRGFPYTRPWGEQLNGFLLDLGRTVFLAIVGAVPGLVFVVVIVLVTRFLVRLVRLFFAAVEEGRVDVPDTVREVAVPTRKVATVVVWIFALIMAYPYLPGSQSEAFKGVSVLVGLMVSLGSTALVGQVVSGFMLMYSRSVRAGDYVRAGDVEGWVTTLGLMTTRVRSIKGEEIVIPKGTLAGMVIKHYSRTADPNGLVVHTGVTIGYDTPWRQVEGLLLLAAERTPGLKREPLPWVLKRALTDFYVDYELNAYIEDPNKRIPVLSALHASVLDTFNEYGVQITSPNYVSDPETVKVVPREKWFEAPARTAGEPAEAGPAR